MSKNFGEIKMSHENGLAMDISFEISNTETILFIILDDDFVLFDGRLKIVV